MSGLSCGVILSRSLSSVTLACSVFLPILALAQQDRNTHKLVVDYTGRLFGYYRIEPDGRPSALAPVNNFLDKRRQPDPAGDLKTKPLLLGMGDNFGPEFGASIQQELGKQAESYPCYLPAAPEDPKDLAPEILYKSETRKPYLAECDNVSRFLMTAGYTAITPGREDFLYSGTWLRRIAVLLRGASGDFDAESDPLRSNPLLDANRKPIGLWRHPEASLESTKLHMLAANLRVRVTQPADTSKAVSCPLLFSRDLASETDCSSGDDSISATMGWLSRIDSALDPVIRQSLYRQSTGDARTDPRGRQFAEQLLTNEVAVLASFLKAEPGAQVLGFGKTGVIAQELNDLATKLEELAKGQAGGNFANAIAVADAKLMAIITSDKMRSTAKDRAASAARSDLLTLGRELHERIGTRVTTSPLLSPDSLRAMRNLLLRDIASEEKNVGYTVVQSSPEASKTLIIGVVGKETMQEASFESFAVYPDLFDCRGENSGKQEGPVCALWHKLYGSDTRNPPPDPQNDKIFDRQNAYQISPGDPLQAAETVLRAAWLQEGSIDDVVLMAQMPASEADEVGSHLRAHLHDLYKDERAEEPSLDLILSEGQAEHSTGDETLGADPGQAAPVFTPYLAYDRLNAVDPYPVSRATVVRHYRRDSDLVAVVARSFIHNQPQFAYRQASVPPLSETDSGCQDASRIIPTGKDLPDKTKPWTAACLLERQLETARPAAQSGPLVDTDLTRLWGSCTTIDEAKQLRSSQACQNIVLMRYLLHALQSRYDTDLAVLKRRDFWFGPLPSHYDGYEVCDTWVSQHDSSPPFKGARNLNFAQQFCRLHVALDRVLWRGDISARALVDGTTLMAMIKTAQQQVSVETTLLPNDLHEEWLTTFGVTSKPATNLVVASAGPESFNLPGMDGCKAPADPPLGKPDPSQKAASPYCVEGFNIAPDAAYWIATSGQLIKDKVTYKDLSAFVAKDGRHFTKGLGEFSRETYLTTAIAKQVFRTQQSAATVNQAVAESGIDQIETGQQNQRLMQVDISKVVAGYAFTSPNINDTSLGNDLSGVSNTQATTPHSSEMDFEFMGRAVSLPIARYLAFGVQNDFEFDHKRTGNTQGKPPTVVYSINSELVGGFMQFHLPESWMIHGPSGQGLQSARNLPRAFLVFAPFQYQRQVVGTPLYFGFLTPPYTNSPSQQLTVTIPVSDGFNQRIGLRVESGGGTPWSPDVGSYVEIGPEYTVQNHILSGVDMPDLAASPGAPAPHCPVVANKAIYDCVKTAYKSAGATLSNSSHIHPTTLTLHTGGFYWMSHMQKVVDKRKRVSVSFDTTGDSFFLPGYTLPTQNRYAINNKLALNLSVLGNWTFSPTYSMFNFENQGATRIAVNTTSLSMSLKWYYARDTEVPFGRLFWLSGPKSADQTSSSKIK